MSSRGSEALTYSSYLNLDKLLGLQSPVSRPAHPDELHFIVTHQAMELWYKVLLHELARVQNYLEKQSWTQAQAKLARANAILDIQIAQMATLYTLDPQAFMEFRRFLGTASGFQSVQYQALELLSGRRGPEHIRRMRRTSDGQLPELLSDILSAPSLAETASQAPQAAGLRGWFEVYEDPELHGPLFLIGEALIEYDRRSVLWRQEHLLLVERTIGSTSTGTGGGSASYLEKRIDTRFFPFLWETRNRITAKYSNEQ